MKEKGIKNLIIDFGGVLIDLDRQRCIENFAKLGMPNVEAMLNFAIFHQRWRSKSINTPPKSIIRFLIPFSFILFLS